MLLAILILVSIIFVIDVLAIGLCVAAAKKMPKEAKAELLAYFK